MKGYTDFAMGFLGPNAIATKRVGLWRRGLTLQNDYVII